MSKKRIVITGLGAVTPIGIGVESYWSALMAGTSGVERITHFDPAAFDVQIAAEVKVYGELHETPIGSMTRPQTSGAPPQRL